VDVIGKKDRMKICIISPSDKTFISEFLSNYDYESLPIGYEGAPFIGTLISEFLMRGNEVVAITTSEVVNEDYKIKEFSNGNFKWIIVPQRKHAFRFNRFKLGRMLDFFYVERKAMLKMVKLNKPNIIHAHWGYEFAHVALSSGLPYLITLHDNPFKIAKYFKNIYRYFRLCYAEYLIRNMKFMSTVSPYMESYVSRSKGEYRIIPNPINVSYALNELTNQVQKRIDSLDTLKIVMILNGWDKRKNGLNGLLAFKLLKHYFPNAELHLYGADSELNGKANADAKSNKIQNVFFHGSVPNVSLISSLSNYHILLHPALEESFGVVLIEAMALGIPAIGGNRSGAVPWVINNDTLLTDVLNPIEISQTVLNCVEHYKQFGLQAYENVKTRFSTNSVCDAYLSYYKDILHA
jgi:glycosyltransferase involved in cell wall biosynthesis